MGDIKSQLFYLKNTFYRKNATELELLESRRAETLKKKHSVGRVWIFFRILNVLLLA